MNRSGAGRGARHIVGKQQVTAVCSQMGSMLQIVVELQLTQSTVPGAQGAKVRHDMVLSSAGIVTRAFAVGNKESVLWLFLFP